MSYQHTLAGLLLFHYLLSSYALPNMSCRCGTIQSTDGVYFYGDEMIITCLITKPDHLGGINSSHLYITRNNKQMDSIAVNSSAIVLRKTVTAEDGGDMYVCKIQTDKLRTTRKIRGRDKIVGTIYIEASAPPVAMHRNDVNCTLNNWEILECDWNLYSSDVDIMVQLYKYNGSLIGGNCSDTQRCSWNVTQKLPPGGDVWELRLKQQFSNSNTARRDSEQSNVTIHTNHIVKPKSVESFGIQNIRNNATCLRLKWTYDMSKVHYKKLFKISYRCLSDNCTDKVHAKVVDKLNTTICGLQPGSVYNISIVVFVPGGLYTSEAVSRKHDTVKVDVLKKVETLKITSLELTLGLSLGSVLVVMLCVFALTLRYWKRKVKDCLEPYAIEEPVIEKVGGGGSAESNTRSSDDKEDTPFMKPPKEKIHSQTNFATVDSEESLKKTKTKDGVITCTESHSNSGNDGDVIKNDDHQKSVEDSYSKFATQSLDNADAFVGFLLSDFRDKSRDSEPDSFEFSKASKSRFSDTSGHHGHSMDGYGQIHIAESSSESDSD